jgi:hypothetical protein
MIVGAMSQARLLASRFEQFLKDRDLKEEHHLKIVSNELEPKS